MMAAGCASMHLALPLRRPRARVGFTLVRLPGHRVRHANGRFQARDPPSSLGYPFLHAVAPVPLCHSTNNYGSRHLERPRCANETQPDVRP